MSLPDSRVGSVGLVFLGSGVCLAVSMLTIYAAPMLGLLDVPKGRHQHAQPIALVGGLSLMVAVAFWLLVQGHDPSLDPFEKVCLFATAGMGLVDDRIRIRARWKALFSLAIAAIIATSNSIELMGAGHSFVLLGMAIPPTFLAVFPLLLLVFWGIPNAFNLIDGANGLATGFALVIFGSMWFSGFHHPFLIGALLTILVLNWPRARLFLGDCGSLSIGLMMVILVEDHFVAVSATHILWMFAYPMIDVAMVVAIRLSSGKSPFEGDRNHLHYRFMDRWPHFKVVAVPSLLGLAAMCAAEPFCAGWLLAIPWAGLLTLVAAAGANAADLVVKPLSAIHRRDPMNLARDMTSSPIGDGT